MTKVSQMVRSLPWRPFERGSRPFLGGTCPQNWLVNQFLLTGRRVLVAPYEYYDPGEGQTSDVQFLAYRNARRVGMIYPRLDALLLLSYDPAKIVAWQINDFEQEFYRMRVLSGGRVRIEQWMYPRRVKKIIFLSTEWAEILQEIKAIPEQGHHTSTFERLSQLHDLPSYQLPGGCPLCGVGTGGCGCEKEEEGEEVITYKEYGQRKYAWSILRPFETEYGNYISDGLLLSNQKIITGYYSEPLRNLGGKGTRWWDRIVCFSCFEGGIQLQESTLPEGILSMLEKNVATIMPEHPGSVEKADYRLRWNKREVMVEYPVVAVPGWGCDKYSWKLWQLQILALPDFRGDWRGRLAQTSHG